MCFRSKEKGMILRSFTQINDCWPVTSWAIVDYFLRPKPAYFTIKRELRLFTVGMTRKEKKIYADDLTAAHFTIDTVLEIWGTNSTLCAKKATLEVTAFDLHSGWKDRWSKDVTLAPNSSTELYSGDLAGQPRRTKLSEVPETIIVSARLLDAGEVLGRYSNWYVSSASFPTPTHHDINGGDLNADLRDNVLCACLADFCSQARAV